MPKSSNPADEPPTEFPQVTPRDLYATSDIRFVMVELAKLSTQVGRLIEDVKGLGEKVDTLRHQVTFVRGVLWVIGIVLVLIGGAVAWYFTGKLSITLKPGG